MTPRLHVVTGKGGTGKTTVAAALALALATPGKRALLCEVEERQALAQLFDVGPLSYQERKIAVVEGHGEVYGLAVDPEHALLEYLQMFYKLGRAGRTLDKIGAIDFATTVAPGLRDLLTIGKAYEAAMRRIKGGRRRVYDAIVLDAPPTGRIARFLNVSTEVAGLAKVGPIHRHAESIRAFLQSPETAVHVVTLLEEMPVQEAADGIASLGEVGIPVGAVIVNRVRESPLSTADVKQAISRRLSRTEIARGLRAARITPTDDLVDGLLAEAADHAMRMEMEQSERKAVVDLGRPVFELPLLRDAIDLGGLYELAGGLRDIAGAAT